MAQTDGLESIGYHNESGKQDELSRAQKLISHDSLG